MEILAGKGLLIGCCVWAVYVIFRIGSDLLTTKRKSQFGVDRE
jgi:hypothetical protein